MKDLTDQNPPRGAHCETCRRWIGGRGNNMDHDRELHQIAALERIAAALEQINPKEEN